MSKRSCFITLISASAASPTSAASECHVSRLVFLVFTTLHWICSSALKVKVQYRYLGNYFLVYSYPGMSVFLLLRDGYVNFGVVKRSWGAFHRDLSVILMRMHNFQELV